MLSVLAKNVILGFLKTYIHDKPLQFYRVVSIIVGIPRAVRRRNDKIAITWNLLYVLLLLSSRL